MRLGRTDEHTGAVGLGCSGHSRLGLAKGLTNGHAAEIVRAAPGVKSKIEAAYRFCRHEPGADLILTDTSSIDHLAENIEAILAPKLPETSEP